ncbi:Endo-beta-mannanase [Limihaloglobus sulfuriphilus]|uniref:Endo-beta-mannanase n=1 Tax=Limihaloglobus sulfuriphilus TaxID=1851148 RepID=A0A1Q2MHV8_9BACT|nr:cellulase family glycosylhydrolase [Limihaloglobus sulfuriphilus]AQQ72239.1 Endo-beta-mannanase [Limihaloglobus sulfuriphilus]
MISTFQRSSFHTSRIAKTVFLIGLAVSLFPLSATAESRLWINTDADSDWHSQANWDTGVPAAGDHALIKGDIPGVWPVIRTAQTAAPGGIWIGYSNTASTPAVNLEYGGRLETDQISVGFIAGGVMNIEGGTLEAASSITLGGGNAEYGYSRGTVNIFAGRSRTANLFFGSHDGQAYMGGTGRLNLFGGSLRTHILEGLDNQGSSINIENGVLVISGDYTLQDVDNWVNTGRLSAFGGKGKIVAEDVGYIVITAQGPRYGLSSFYDDGQIDLDDAAAMAQNWLASDCSAENQWCGGADINGDGSVNTEDFTRLARHWQSGPYYGLRVQSDGNLYANGVPYSGFGVNYFDCFVDQIKNPSNGYYVAGLEGLGERNIKYARMAGCGFWPVDMQMYFDDKTRYLRTMDRIVNTAEENGVGLIPSLFWTHYTIADILGEPVNSVGNENSQTAATMKEYIREIVTRYKNSPAIWGWEVGNEWNLPTDLPNAEAHRPPTYTNLGNPAERTEQDELTSEMQAAVMRFVAAEIRKYDPYRLISSGNSYPRQSSWNQWQFSSWETDTIEQKRLMFKLQNPDPINCISVHYYDTARDLELAKSVADSVGKVLFVGEFGASGTTQQTQDDFYERLNYVQASNAPISGLWNYNRNFPNDDYNILPDYSHPRHYQLEAIMQLNE